MRPIVISPINKEIKVESTERYVQLSSERKNEIEEFWLEINQEKSFHQGR